MKLDVTPPVDEVVERVLHDALVEEGAGARQGESAWTKAARAEAVERDDAYAFSPRSTRGATRA